MAEGVGALAACGGAAGAVTAGFALETTHAAHGTVADRAVRFPPLSTVLAEYIECVIFKVVTNVR